MKNKVSIIVPVHNSEKTIIRCLKSIKSQTYDELECLVIDDASDDSSLSIIKSFIGNDSRFTVYSLKENHGVACARNYGLSKAKGEYITFVDSDDLIHPKMLEILVNTAISTGHSLISCKSYEKSSTDNIEINWNINPDVKTTFFNLDSSFDYDCDASVTCWGSLYRYDILKDLYFDESLFVGEDSLFWAQALVNANGVEKVDSQLYCYIVYLESALHGELDQKRFSEVLAWEKIADYFQKKIPKTFIGTFKATFYSAYSFRLRQKYILDKDGKFRKILRSKAAKCLGEILQSNLSNKKKISALLFVIWPKIWLKISNKVDYI